MSISAQDITIIVTVYNRRDYIKQAVASALAQTIPVSVMVVEDCGPDPGMMEFITAEFGSRIRYHRNPERRGIFGNLNACLELCQTSWLSILHDDDFLEPRWAEAVLELAKVAPERALYHVGCRIVDSKGIPTAIAPQPEKSGWTDLDLKKMAMFNSIWFPGQLINREKALQAGGFRVSSQFCGDWELWIKLAARWGASGTNNIVANMRDHDVGGRGTMKISRNGRKFCCENVQRKRNVAFLSSMDIPVDFDRRVILSQQALPLGYLVANAHGFSKRFLRYNTSLYNLSRVHGIRNRLFQICSRFFGPCFATLASKLWLALNQ